MNIIPPSALKGVFGVGGLFIALILIVVVLYIIDWIFPNLKRSIKIPMFLHKELKDKFMAKYKGKRNK
jgi:hypothetical protein